VVSWIREKENMHELYAVGYCVTMKCG